MPRTLAQVFWLKYFGSSFNFRKGPLKPYPSIIPYATMAEAKMLEILTELQKDVKDVKQNQKTTSEQIAGILKEMNKKFEEFDGKIKEMDTKFAELRKMVLEMQGRQGALGEEERVNKFQRTGMSTRRAASADGRAPRKQVVLLGFPKELMQPTLLRVAESIKQKIGHTGAPPNIKVYDFSRKAMFIFQSEAHAETFVERAGAIDIPFECPISKEKVSLRLKLHVPGDERTHAKTIGALRNRILEKRGDLDLGSNGFRGEVFVRDGELGVKLFKVQEVMHDGMHKIEANLTPLATLGIDEGAVNNIIKSAYADVANPFRR